MIKYEQAEDVKEIMKKNGFKNIEIKKDLSEINRVVSGVKGLVPFKNIKEVRGLLKGIDTTIEREEDRY